jgi:glutathione S-transferase
LPSDRRVPAVIETASWEFRNAVSVLASPLKDRLYLAGTAFSVADILAGHTLLWARSARVPLGSDFPDAYLQRLLARPALTRARAAANEPA